jgi:DNA-directed RNA polymerase specialized sigma24 family protein
MRGRREGVEPVLQSIRETVWRRAATYDANLGRPQDFVFGVTRNLLRKELAKAVPTHVELNEAALPTAAPDPLSSLLSRFDAHRWMRFVADAVGEDDWQRVVDLAFDDLGADAHSAEATRSIRTVRDRVALVASTVRAALMAADNGSAATLDIAACCVPDVAGLRTVLPLLDSSCDDIAARLGLHPGTVRSRVATVRRLLDIAMLVLRSEAI